MSCNCGKCQVCNFTESQMLRGYDEEDQSAEIEHLLEEISRLNKELESTMTFKLALEAGALQHFKDLSHALAKENRMLREDLFAAEHKMCDDCRVLSEEHDYDL